MSQSLRPHDVIANRVKQLRADRGWSAAHLAKQLKAVGIPWDRSIAANFEIRRRESVSVAELLGLAYVLGVSPLHLLVPPRVDDSSYAATPNDEVPMAVISGWLRGVGPLSGQHPGWFAEARDQAKICTVSSAP